MKIALLVLADLLALGLMTGAAQSGSPLSLLFAFVGGALFENILRSLAR